MSARLTRAWLVSHSRCASGPTWFDTPSSAATLTPAAWQAAKTRDLEVLRCGDARKHPRPRTVRVMAGGTATEWTAKGSAQVADQAFRSTSGRNALPRISSTDVEIASLAANRSPTFRRSSYPPQVPTKRTFSGLSTQRRREVSTAAVTAPTPHTPGTHPGGGDASSPASSGRNAARRREAILSLNHWAAFYRAGRPFYYPIALPDPRASVLSPPRRRSRNEGPAT